MCSAFKSCIFQIFMWISRRSEQTIRVKPQNRDWPILDIWKQPSFLLLCYASIVIGTFLLLSSECWRLALPTYPTRSLLGETSFVIFMMVSLVVFVIFAGYCLRSWFKPVNQASEVCPHIPETNDRSEPPTKSMRAEPHRNIWRKHMRWIARVEYC